MKATYLGPDGPDPLRTLSARLKETLLARSNLEKVVTEFNLFPDVLEKRGMVDAVDRLRMKITFKARSTDTFAISAEGETREQAQEVTQRLADILVEETTRMRRSQAKLTNEFLDSELKRAEQDVEKAETELAAFLAEHPEFAAEQAAPGGAQTGAAIRAQERRTTTADPTLEALDEEALHVPAAFAEFHGEPVEQFGMGGRISHDAEVFAGLHQARAEELLPEAIHRHAGGEGVRRTDEPLGEAEAVLRCISGKFAECGWHGGFDGFAHFVILAAHEDVGHGLGIHALFLNVGEGAAGLDGVLLGGQLRAAGE
ncbi:MAG TPA: hypothetical protein VL242_39810, partial [Sorangium sp.]|nr:hypothetical protein [Sorangium sp.]